MWVQIGGAGLLAYRAAATAIDGRFPRPGRGHARPSSSGPTVGPQITLKAMELHGGYGVTTDYPIQPHPPRLRHGTVVAGGAPAVLR